MTRGEVIKQLAGFSGPLGPLESLEERIRRRDKWLAVTDSDIAGLLLEVLMHPPDVAELLPATRDDFELEISEVLTLLGQRDPSSFLERVGPLLVNDRARPTLIEVIGALRRQEGIYWLRTLLNSAELTEDEHIRLACALGEIKGLEARMLLERIRLSISSEMKSVRREIDIALQRT
ncbi:MAG: hypothetical protein P0119_19335 [Nitrospira sp.]|nr:hypothetical protein [Nitrospira sp.]